MSGSHALLHLGSVAPPEEGRRGVRGLDRERSQSEPGRARRDLGPMRLEGRRQLAREEAIRIQSTEAPVLAGSDVNTHFGFPGSSPPRGYTECYTPF